MRRAYTAWPRTGFSNSARPTPVKQARRVPRIVCGLLKRYTASAASPARDMGDIDIAGADNVSSSSLASEAEAAQHRTGGLQLEVRADARCSRGCCRRNAPDTAASVSESAATAAISSRPRMGDVTSEKVVKRCQKLAPLMMYTRLTTH